MSNPNPKRGKKPTLKGLGEARHYPDLPARVIDTDGRTGRFAGNHVLLDTGETVDPDGCMVVWPMTAEQWSQQRVSFAYGNLAASTRHRVGKDDVRRAAEEVGNGKA